jgi:hypothetical protein
VTGSAGGMGIASCGIVRENPAAAVIRQGSTSRGGVFFRRHRPRIALSAAACSAPNACRATRQARRFPPTGPAAAATR